MNQYRQGDILFVQIDPRDLPSRLSEMRRKDRTVAFGEVTGHHHTLTGGEVYGTLEGQQWVVAETPVELEHQEHETIVIPEGSYRVIRQREWGDAGAFDVSD